MHQIPKKFNESSNDDCNDYNLRDNLFVAYLGRYGINLASSGYTDFR